MKEEGDRYWMDKFVSNETTTAKAEQFKMNEKEEDWNVIK